MSIGNDLIAVSKGIQVLNKKIQEIIKAVEKIEKEKTTAPTATDQVLSVINKSKKGVDVGTLKKKTGFNEKKIRNILFRIHKEGKIQRIGKGIYTGVK